MVFFLLWLLWFYIVHTPTGQDDLLWCSSCGQGYNQEVLNSVTSGSAGTACSQCGSRLEQSKGIEVGHSFLLGDKYSATFNATCLPQPGDKQSLLQMGCYGLGVTRILGRI
jgi:prolyl-tRNA synthetase